MKYLCTHCACRVIGAGAGAVHCTSRVWCQTGDSGGGDGGSQPLRNDLPSKQGAN